ncbi:MAG TPA: alpha/beta hydrolase [Bacillales bacterium]|nr:alpha/beta hydrolase [Bacillales bacterium]
MPSLTVRSIVPTYYEQIGSGTPIVFLHPPHMDHTVFLYQRSLAKSFQVVFYDFRGHGRSGVDPRPVTISSLAEELYRFIDRLDLEQVVLCGYSSGGSVAQEFALNHPERTKALILSGGFPRVNTFLLANEFRLGMALVKAGRHRLLSRVFALTHKLTEDDERVLYDHCMRTDGRSAYEFYESSFRYDCTDRLHALTVPLLLLNGTRSRLTHPYIQQYARSVDRFTSVFIDRGRHMMLTRSHKPFNQAITHFIKRLDAAFPLPR